MKGDILLFGGLINLMISSVAAWYAWSIYMNERANYLKYIAFYTATFNLFMLTALIITYMDGHPPEYLSFDQRWVLRESAFLVLSLLQYTLVSLMMAITLSFLKREILVWMKLVCGFIGVTILAGYVLLMILYWQGIAPSGLRIGLHLVADNGILLEIPILLLLIILSFSTLDRKSRALAQNFGLLYLTRYLLASIAIVYMIQFQAGDVANVLIINLFILVFNIVPFVWFRGVYHPRLASMLVQASEQVHSLEKLAALGLSKREIEVAEEVIAGRSNQEIAGALFVSLSTIKNHVHNIYTKLGINSRYELINISMGRSVKGEGG